MNKISCLYKIIVFYNTYLHITHYYLFFRIYYFLNFFSKLLFFKLSIFLITHTTRILIRQQCENNMIGFKKFILPRLIQELSRIIFENFITQEVFSWALTNCRKNRCLGCRITWGFL